MKYASTAAAVSDRLKKEYGGIQENASKNLWLIALCALALFSGIPAGYFTYEDSKEYVAPLIKSLTESIESNEKADMASGIFLNNLRATAFMFLLGTLVVPAALALFSNGFLLGYVMKYLEELGYGPLFFVKGVLAHSLFEVPAILLSAAIGIRIGISYMTFDNQKRTRNVSAAIKQAIKTYVLLIIPLLFVAAIVETYVSAELIG